jgi:hypothetical protein
MLCVCVFVSACLSVAFVHSHSCDSRQADTIASRKSAVERASETDGRIVPRHRNIPDKSSMVPLYSSRPIVTNIPVYGQPRPKGPYCASEIMTLSHMCYKRREGLLRGQWQALSTSRWPLTVQPLDISKTTGHPSISLTSPHPSCMKLVDIWAFYLIPKLLIRSVRLLVRGWENP